MRTKLIIKFGGSSLADAACFRKAASIVLSRIENNPIVVVSAVGISNTHRIKITDLLKNIAIALLKGKEYETMTEKLLNRHMDLIRELSLPESILNEEIEELKRILTMISGKKFGSENEALDALMGRGEVFSSRILSELLSAMGKKFQTANPVSLDFITDDNFQNANILPSSLERIAARTFAIKEMFVFPGYIGLTNDGRMTTLGRGGSDYTAAIFGAALKRDVEIWTDVNGIYRIAPNHLPSQFKASGHPETIKELSYEEAFQMAAFGSRVLYEKALLAVHEAVRKGKHIQILIKNTFNPEHQGTVISSKRHHTGEPRGITVLEGTQLFNVYPDTEEEAEGFLNDLSQIEGISVMLSSKTIGRLSVVLDKYDERLSVLEAKYNSHLSKDQVLIKIVGDGLGENPRKLLPIHGALQQAENTEKHGMTVVHKSPQLLTDNTFELLVKKRGLPDVLLALYKNLFMGTTVTVGLLGLGVVGSGVINYARESYSPEKGGFDLRFPAAFVRNLKKKRDGGFEGVLTNNPDDIINDPLVDIVLEVMGGIEPARTLIMKALKQGKHVITANKALLAEHGLEIFSEADKYRCNLGFEASVCGEIPIIDDFLKFPGLMDIEGIEGIVNGTSNYVLTKFMEGMSPEDSIKIAQEKGFAEADPALDLSGADASQKLSILASILFNQPVDYKKISCQGITELKSIDRLALKIWNFVIKPLVVGRVSGNKLSLRVSPAFISYDHPLASVRDENNALVLYLKGRKEPITKIGKGAGSIPTARSIVKDIMDVSRKSRAFMLDLPGFFKSKKIRDIETSGEFETEWYMRLNVTDYPGVFGRIATILGDFEISIRRVLQEEIPSENNAYILLELKKTPWSKLERAVDVILKFQFVNECFTCMIEYNTQSA